MFEHRITMKYNNYPSRMKQRMYVIVKKIIKQRSKFKMTEKKKNKKEHKIIKKV